MTGNLDITYNFPAGTNNGKISSQKDNISVETVTYQYDSLNRLLSATSNQAWSETYGFDGFGNLTSKTPTGGAPTLSIAVDPATNHIVGQSYDSHGNQLMVGSGYDAENRLDHAPGVKYAYDSANKRIWRGTVDGNGNLTAQEVYFYGLDGQKMGRYPLQVNGGQSVTAVLADSSTTAALSVYFGRKKLGTYDRLGTAKFNANGQPQSFYPYGEDRGTVQPNDSLKFATYTRDTATGLDYADQRYYASNFGRFMSPDPYMASAATRAPQTWNRYAYTIGDPVNYADRRGNNVMQVSSDCTYVQYWQTNFDGDGKIITIPVCVITVVVLPGSSEPPPLLKQKPPKDLDNRFWVKHLQYLLNRSVNVALAALSQQKCADLFKNEALTPQQLLTTLLAGNTDYGKIEFSDSIPQDPGYITNATTQPLINVPNSPIENGALISLNANMPSAFTGGNTINAAAVLIHELGHAFDVIWGPGASLISFDNGDTALSGKNQDMVLEDCFGITRQ